MNVLLVGYGSPYCLEASYKRAFAQLRVAVNVYDIYQHQSSYTRFGRFGAAFHRFVPVDAWERKVNRHLALHIQQTRPDLVLVFCNAPVLFSTLAFVKSVLPTRFVLVWPDPLTNMLPHVQQAACLYDSVATYCRASVPMFEQMGFRQVRWVPLAADPVIHPFEGITDAFAYDLTFVGAWRPEREHTLTEVVNAFPKLNIGVWGTNWKRVQSRALRPFLHHKVLSGRAYSQLFSQSRINLNLIDPTCYPAANMRFFEIPSAGGLQLSNDCPELDTEYVDQQHITYFRSSDQLLRRIETLLERPHDTNDIRRAGYAHTLARHTYRHRAEQIQDLCLSSRSNS